MVDSMEKKKIIEIEINSVHEINSAYANAITKFKECLSKYYDFGNYNDWNVEIKLLKIRLWNTYRERGCTVIFEIELF